MEPEELAEAVVRLSEWAQRHAPQPEPALHRRLREHFGADPLDLPVVTRSLEAWDRPNVQVALDEWLTDKEFDVIGIAVMAGYRAGLGELVRGGEWAAEVQLGGAEYVTVPLGADESISCVLRARHFHEDEGAPLTVRSLPNIAREQIVLADGVLEAIERQAFGVARHAERLRASGRHLRRGLLLHGPPGVGKTLTAMYLATQMPDRTVVLLTGQGVGSLSASVDLATALQPAMVILEDVDLVAMERSFQPTNAILFELLNAMDGLDEDHDVLFVLTTNRADVLEPALAARPGRIDQAVELPLPDASARRRLLELYGRGLDLTFDDGDRLIDDLDDASPAFIRELLRRSAILAAEEDDDGPLRVTHRHLHDALDELRGAAGDLTQTLLGARPSAPPSAVDGPDQDG